MADEAWEMLMRYYREVLKPDFDRLRSEIDVLMTKAEFDMHMAKINRRFDELHAYNQDMLTTFQRIEDGMTATAKDSEKTRSH
ncbi:MAG: hypothetical protein QOE82_3875 [Thermoanaerobaculia bacterium]|jgi:uncharacterized coiled-coil DUF342 family protein|nr:hypothetical protein [Thermoanaerobaculia bacterium]